MRGDLPGPELGAWPDGSSHRAGASCGGLFSPAGGMCAGVVAAGPGRSITWCRSSWAAATICPICGRRVAAAIRARARRWAIACGASAGMAAKGLLAARGGLPGTGEKRHEFSLNVCAAGRGRAASGGQHGAIRWPLVPHPVTFTPVWGGPKRRSEPPICAGRPGRGLWLSSPRISILVSGGAIVAATWKRDRVDIDSHQHEPEHASTGMADVRRPPYRDGKWMLRVG
jgi:hypothetical protein